MGHVKSKRSYDSSGRQAQARRNREAVLDAAERRFLADGYAATTVAAVAGDAGVSVETVYKAFGGKSGLVVGLYQRGLAGRGAVPAFQRSDEMREHETDPRTIMRNWGLLAAEVGSVITPIRLLMRLAAATDPDMAALVEAGDDERLQRMRHHARVMAERGYLRDGVTSAEAADVFWICNSVELYELLVLKRGWSQRRFAQFVTDLLIASLLPQNDGNASDSNHPPRSDHDDQT
jgi:AcrR family transcriptional regulator